MEGGRDPFNRMPFIWGREDEDLLAFYRRLGQIRKKLPMLADGSLTMPDTGHKGRLLILRESAAGELAIAANLTEVPWEMEFAGDVVRLLDPEGGETLNPGEAEYFLLR